MERSGESTSPMTSMSLSMTRRTKAWREWGKKESAPPEFDPPFDDFNFCHESVFGLEVWVLICKHRKGLIGLVKRRMFFLFTLKRFMNISDIQGSNCRGTSKNFSRAQTWSCKSEHYCWFGVPFTGVREGESCTCFG